MNNTNNEAAHYAVSPFLLISVKSKYNHHISPFDWK